MKQNQLNISQFMIDAWLAVAKYDTFIIYLSLVGKKNLVKGAFGSWIWKQSKTSDESSHGLLKHIQGFLLIKLWSWNMYETNFTQLFLEVW